VARVKRSREQEARRFGVILAVFLAGVAALWLWRGHTGRAGVAGVAALLAGLLPFAAPSLWLRFFALWMRGAEALGWVMTRVLLSVFFFVALTPIGLLMRLFGKRPLDLAWKDGRATYWIDKAAQDASVERYEKQF
jgi:saxitoxin biosynthesis operon SxtJ-like protein